MPINQPHRPTRRQPRFFRRGAALAGLTAFALMTPLAERPAHAQQEQQAAGDREALEVDRRARHLYDTAMELMEYRQYERGLAMLDTVIRDNQGNILGYRAHMAKGKHYLDQHQNDEALSHFLLLSRLLAPAPGESPSEEETELYREALFQAGFAYYQSGQYNAAFPMFRRLTEVAGRTEWANRAYFYIGMSHYHLENWNMAIDALSLVGTEIEEPAEGEEGMGRVEIGQRFYAKITDADIPVLRRIGQDVTVLVEVSSGDSATLTAVPIPGKENEALVSAPTEIGPPNPADDVLQMIGGDTITVTYVDASTLDGQTNVQRTGTVRAVSTGTVGFFLGDYSTPAYIAFPGQPQAVVLMDADLDTSNQAETVTVTIRSLYQVDPEEAAEEDAEDALDIFDIAEGEEDVWRERDAITIVLTEQVRPRNNSADDPEEAQGPVDSDGNIRTGFFAARANLAPLGDETPSLTDNILHCDELDELEVTYTDSTHLYGEEERTVSARVQVSGSVNAGVRADQYEVYESVLRARKNAVEAEALLGLGEIYKDMGLDERASQHADEALQKVDEIILDRDRITSDLLERAFQLKWECEILKEDFVAATATCQAFNRLYPQSVLADQALMALSRTLAEQGEFTEAIASYRRVLALENPVSAAEAQYRIGEVMQRQVEIEFADQHNSRWTQQGLSAASARQRALSGAMNAYRQTYQAYPESPFAASALRQVVTHYVDTEDFDQADDLLDQVFADFPDAPFLDEMLLMWAQVAYRMGDSEMAQAKLRQLIFDYPSSQHVDEAQRRLTALRGGE